MKKLLKLYLYVVIILVPLGLAVGAGLHKKSWYLFFIILGVFLVGMSPLVVEELSRREDADD